MKQENPDTHPCQPLPSSSASTETMAVFSFYPAIPPPVDVDLLEIAEHTCSYLPDRPSMSRAFRVERLSPALYQKLMDAGFRRSGKVIYQPTCRGCRACVPLRVQVDAFQASKSQRRCWRKNADVSVTFAPPILTDEKFQMYERYQTGWHDRSEPVDRQSMRDFLYDSPVDTIEMEYRDSTGRLLGVGICDICSESTSSVYFYFDPHQAERGLGTYSVMREIKMARELGLKHLYLGYCVFGCGKMEYKMQFRPHELLHGDGHWRPAPQGSSTPEGK